MLVLKKQFIPIFLSCLFTTLAFAQIRVGDFRLADSKFKKLDKKAVVAFKNQTTHFILPDKFTKAAYTQILDEVWNVTPYKITLSSEFDSETVQPGDALAQFLIYTVTKYDKTAAVKTYQAHYEWNVLDFHVVGELREKGKYIRDWKSSKIGTIYFSEGLIAEDNKPSFKSAIINLDLGYLKNYLAAMNSAIKTETSHNTLEDFQTKELAQLQGKTLYMDEYFGYDRRISTMGDKELSLRTDLVDIYDYNMQFIPHAELQNKILSSGSEEFYYLLVNLFGSNKVVTVINGKTGAIIFQSYKKVGRTITKKDIKELNKRIKKEIDS